MNTLILKQYQAKLNQLIDLVNFTRPKEGWIRTTRKALGMSGPQLAQRLDLSASQVSQMERLELEDRITLRKLRDVAGHLDCELVYAFVPRKPIDEIVRQQARQKAADLVQKTHHQMLLEDQQLSNEKLNEMIEQETFQIMQEMPRYLWDK